MVVQEVFMNIKKGCLVVASVLLAAGLFACSDSNNPGLPENEVVGGADDGAAVSETALADEGGEAAATEEKAQAADEADESQKADAADVADATQATDAADSKEAPQSAQAADVAEVPVQEPTTVDPAALDSAVLDSIFNILFPDGIEGIDTARHDPDSVGVWHFYDPRGTHDNPDFAYGSMTDPRDGIVYKTTTIGGQVWMAENLNYFDIEGAPSSIKNDWCYWDKPENCESAGRLYTWTVAKRVCPEGWRLPTNEDWTALLTAVGADTLNPIAWTGANALKSKSGWENSGSGTDDYGFTALPAGKAFFNDLQSGFTNHGCSSYMWSATEADPSAGGDTLAFSVELNCSNEFAIVNTVKKYSGFSIRCVKD